MELAKGVKIGGVKAHTVLAMMVVEELLLKKGLWTPLVVTSCLRIGSAIGAGLHGTGDALDLRVHYFFTEKKGTDRELSLTMLATSIKGALGDELDVVLEDPNEGNEHIHVEYDPR